MRRLITLAILSAVVAVSPSQRANAQSAKEIIEKAVTAHGGADNMKKYPGVKTTSKGKMNILNQDVDIESQDTVLLPDQFKSVMTMNLIGMKIEVVQIYNAGKLKMTANGIAPPLSDGLKKEMTGSMDLHAATELYPLLDDKNKFELSVIEKPGKVGDKEVVGVLVKTKNNQDIKLFFDAKTFVLLKIERKGLDFAEKEVNQEMLMQDHKKVDGILRPMKYELLFDGKKVATIETAEIKNLEKVDKKEFDVSD